MKKKILLLTPYFPYPVYSGGNQAQFSMIDNLRNRYDFTILFNKNLVNDVTLSELTQKWNNVSFIPYKDIDDNTIKNETFARRCKKFIYKLRSRFKNLSNKNQIDNPSTLYHSLNFYHTENLLNIVYKLSRDGFDIVQVEFYEFLPLIHLLPNNVTRIFIHHELRYVRNSLEMSLFTKQSTYDKYIYNLSKMVEINNLKLYDKIVTVSDIDKAKLLKELPHNEIISSPSFLQLKKIVRNDSFTFKNKLVFLGSPSHYPNKDGLRWFSENVWSSVNNFELHVIGGWKKQEVEELFGSLENIIIYSYVQDLSPILEDSIFIVPIRIGSGIRMKILEAIENNIPLITTNIGCEGLNLVNNEDCLIGDSAEDFIANIMKLSSDESLQQKLIINASKKIDAIYNKDELIKKRIEVYES